MTSPVRVRLLQPPTRGRHLTAVFVGMALFHLAQLLGDETRLWFPALGVGVTLCAWFGVQLVPLLALDLFLVRATQMSFGSAAASSLIVAVEIAVAWELYRRAGGSRYLEDASSATLFLLLVPGGVSLVGATLHAGLASGGPFVERVAYFWIARLLGHVALTPFLWVVIGPALQDLRCLQDEPGKPFSLRQWTWGDAIETAGLGLGAGILSLVQTVTHVRTATAWPLWGVAMLLVVWSAIRQGLRGGTTTTFFAALLALAAAGALGATPQTFAPLQGFLLGQCSTALLVGAAIGWIRLTETHYRQIAGNVPIVLSTVRLVRPMAVEKTSSAATGSPLRWGPDVAGQAEVAVVSAGARRILGVDPSSLQGEYAHWLDLVDPADHPVVVAALTQLALDAEPITYEYRLKSASPQDGHRWIRESLTPQCDETNRLVGWDSVVEDVTESRALQHENRRIAGMLEALVADLPMGVFFARGADGHPLLVNARARALLGQREFPSADVTRFPSVYRLHRADGSEYPYEELPIYRALRMRVTCTANDLVVHRPDGRRVPLFAWAAPVDLGALGGQDAAVWVLEDLSALQQAESARRESEARLRAVFDTLAEGVLVQNGLGVVLEANPAARAILKTSVDDLVGQTWLAPDGVCLRDDGAPLPPDQHPDRLALQIQLPVRNLLLGWPRKTGETVWLLVNALPLPVGTAFLHNSKGAKLVTTFTDVTATRTAQQAIVAAKERYQSLVESVPVLLVQFDAADRVTYLNPTAQRVLRRVAADLAEPGQWKDVVEPADHPACALAIQNAQAGNESRFEVRFRGDVGHVGYAFVAPRRQDGKLAGCTWLVVDLTRERRLEEELYRSQRLELVGRLAAHTTHDFHQLLGTIAAAADSAQRESDDRPVVAENLSLIRKTAANACGLLERTLSVGRETPERRPLEVRTALEAAVDALRPSLGPDVVVDLDAVEGGLHVDVEEAAFRQIALNLLLNARDAMPDGGHITLTASPDLIDGKPLVRILFADTGHGMTHETLTRAFEPFFTTKTRGAGLGLSIVRDLVERHGGTLSAWSEPDRGARFTLRFRETPG